MPELKCTVQTCMHNKDFYCDLNAITVGGKSERKAGNQAGWFHTAMFFR